MANIPRLQALTLSYTKRGGGGGGAHCHKLCSLFKDVNRSTLTFAEVSPLSVAQAALLRRRAAPAFLDCSLVGFCDTGFG